MPRRPQRPTRTTEVQRTRARLLRHGFPRVQMFILVSLTGLAGLLASFLMLLAGVETMALRYVLAMGVAYAVFMLLLWLWLRTRADDYGDLIELTNVDGGIGPSAAKTSPDFSGGAGSFDGGGASADVDFSSDGLTGDGGVSELLSGPAEAVASADEGAIPLAVLLMVVALALGVVGMALSSLFVVWSAPMLFAEITVDALLSAGLYRRLRHLEARTWLHTALRRTIVPFVLTTLVMGAAGLGMQHYAPEARSIGQVIKAAGKMP